MNVYERAAARKADLAQKMRVRGLVIEGFSDTDIATELNIEPATVVSWVSQYKFDELRKPNPTPEEMKERQRYALEQREQWKAKVSTESAAMSVDGFKLAREKLESGDARGFNDAARGLNTFVQLTRQAEGMDNDAKDKRGGDTINFWVARIGEGGIVDTKAEPIDVTPKPVADDIAF